MIRLFSDKFKLLVMLVFWSLSMAGISQAQVADTACDPEYMDAIEARGWMTGQRRVSQNNNLIFKPDSVIEFGCFNEVLDVVVAGPQRMFSESTYWGNISTFTPFSTDSAMVAVVGDALVNYLNTNFMHNYLSSRLLQPTPSIVRTPGIFDCVSMSFVWGHSRCLEFMDEYTLEGFFDFTAYETFDPRLLPSDFGICDPIAQLQMGSRITDAYNYGGTGLPRILSLETPNEGITDGTPYEEDPMFTGAITYASSTSGAADNTLHLEFMLGGDCAQSPVIPTGLFVARQDGVGQYEEHFCTVPGCSYNGTSCVQ